MCLYHANIRNLNNKLNKTRKVCTHAHIYTHKSKKLLFIIHLLDVTSLHQQPLSSAFVTRTLCSNIRIFLLDVIFS